MSILQALRRWNRASAMLLVTVLLSAPAQGLSAGAERRSGFDQAGQDTSVAPGDDFFSYANGAFMRSLAIPADKSGYGVQAIAEARTEERVHRLLVGNESKPGTRQAGTLQARQLYRSFLDEARVDARGVEPLRPGLTALAHVRDRVDLARFLAVQDGFRQAPFTPALEVNLRAPDHYALVLRQGGLGLPDRDFYFGNDQRTRDRYKAYIARLLESAGWKGETGRTAAEAVLAFETAIAKASLPAADARDFDKNYVETNIVDLERLAPGFPWRAYLDAAGLPKVKAVVLAEHRAFPGIASAWERTPLDVLKAWAAFHLIDNAAPYLSSVLVAAHFDFHGKALSGQAALSPRWQRAMALENDLLGEAVGRLYVEAYFPPEAKAKIEAMVANLKAAMAKRIDSADWMDPETKKVAHRKLNRLLVKVGYPDKWRDYSALVLPQGDLVGSVIAARTFEWKRRAERLFRPVDKQEWELPPHFVGAAFNGGEVLFPAGILQSPYFDAGYDDAANYGGIGAVIGHEVTHAFDDQGRKFGENGGLADWWQPADTRAFDSKTARLARQYEGFEPFPGLHVNGQLTLGENIADLGGLLIALDAYHASLGARPAPVLEGLSGDQRFFLAYAQSWRDKVRDEVAKRRLLSNPHSPVQYRVNGVVRNVDAWYRAFSITPSAKLFLAPEARARIW